jgi:hypothetical protein
MLTGCAVSSVRSAWIATINRPGKPSSLHVIVQVSAQRGGTPGVRLAAGMAMSKAVLNLVHRRASDPP